MAKLKKVEQGKRKLVMRVVNLQGRPYIYWSYFDNKTNQRIFNRIERMAVKK